MADDSQTTAQVLEFYYWEKNPTRFDDAYLIYDAETVTAWPPSVESETTGPWLEVSPVNADVSECGPDSVVCIVDGEEKYALRQGVGKSLKRRREDDTNYASKRART